MDAREGPSKIRKYSDAFKLTAVRMTQLPGMQVKTVAAGSICTPSCCPAGGRKCATA